MLETFMAALNFNLQDLIAGFAGGVAASCALEKPDPWHVIVSVIGGGIFGAYFAGPASGVMEHILGSSVPHTAAACAVGVVAMPLAKAWITAVMKRYAK